MIRLDLARAPQRLDLTQGVEIVATPLTTAIFSAARADPALDAVRDTEPELGVALVKAIARRVILSWDGVGDAEGAPIDPSAEAIDALLDIYPIYQAFEALYLAPWLRIGAEGNA